ncbi:MAG: dual specificity protein phosphatase [Myxococcota bacterium]
MPLLDRLLALLGLDFSFDLDEAPFHAITPTLSLGARPRPDQVSALQELGITHVVSCLATNRRATIDFLQEDFETLFFPIHDGIHEDIRENFPAFFAFVEGAAPGRVLVHCEVGVSRSASMAIAFVMKTQHLRFYEAYLEVRRRRPQVLPNVGFASQLQQFEHALFSEPRSDGHTSLTRYLHEVCKVPVEIDVLQDALEDHGFDAMRAIRGVFGDDIPRVIQGVRR